MTSHASRKTKHFPPRLWNSFLTRTLPTIVLCQPRPLPSPGPENSSTHKMRATWEKSHSQLGGPASGRLWRNLRVWDPKSAHPTWQNLPGRRTFFAQEHHLNSMKRYLWMYPAEETASPKGWPALRWVYWIPIQHHQKPAPCSPACRERKDLNLEIVGQPWNMMFFVVSFLKVFHLPTPTLFQSVSLTSFHDTRKVALVPHAPCLFGARMQGKQEVSLSRSQLGEQGVMEATENAPH